MSEHAPTTDQIREAYLDGNGGTHPRAFEPGWGRDRAGDRFDRWLAQHEAELRERIATEIEGLAKSTPYAGQFNEAVFSAADIARGKDQT